MKNQVLGNIVYNPQIKILIPWPATSTPTSTEKEIDDNKKKEAY